MIHNIGHIPKAQSHASAASDNQYCTINYLTGPGCLWTAHYNNMIINNA